MTIFAVLMPSPQPELAEAIQKNYPGDNLSVTPTQWLLSSSESVLDITAKIGIYDVNNPSAPADRLGIVLAISSYHGRAPTVVWDWIKSKLEAKTNG